MTSLAGMSVCVINAKRFHEILRYLFQILAAPLGSIHPDLIWWHFNTPFLMLEKTLKNIYKIFIAATEEKSREALIFQMPQYKRGIIAADAIVCNPAVVCDTGRFLFTIYRPLSRRCHDSIKVWLVQSPDEDVRLISQVDIVMCFIYNISAMSWLYQGWYHFSIVTISACPLATFIIN